MEAIEGKPFGWQEASGLEYQVGDESSVQILWIPLNKRFLRCIEFGLENVLNFFGK